MSQTQQHSYILYINYLLFQSSYVLTVLVQLCFQYTSATCTTPINSAGFLKLRAQECVRYTPCPLIDQAPHNDIKKYNGGS